MFLFGDRLCRLFFDADRRRGMSLRHLLHSLLLSEPWRVSLLCSAVPLAAQDDVECLVGSTSLLDVEGVMLKIQTGSEKNKIFPRLVQEHTYVG